MARDEAVQWLEAIALALAMLAIPRILGLVALGAM